MGGHRFNPEKADKLLSEDRQQQLPYKQFMNMLELKERDVVADLGAGNGYFTIPMAEHTKESVFALDIEPTMIEMLKNRATEAQVNNIEYLVSDLEHIPIASQTIDKVMVSLVIHEVPSIENALIEIRRILKPGGLVLFIEWEAIEADDGPPIHEKIPSEELSEALQTQGFDTTIFQLYSSHYAIKAK
ncbi:Methyltransferase domain-containing protein [Halobacillus karajensis]|uniref:class I SAM-dependent methyltransferase n=1 Tax=Halobacillus karajensis TaxID=195088 RepID=UPI0008A76C5D|nr:class I SAM-dependent methyltransferase [Halobacillus karajensis]SEH77379.1 Methyltransferase domain-containing protein [Halobacillus karajensis]